MTADLPNTQAAKPGPFPVLIIDDNEGDQRLTEIHLSKAWPFEHDLVVDCAGNSREALEKTRQNHYTLVVMDWNLPPMGGDHVLRTLRQNGIRIPVVVLSGAAREHISADLEALGAAFLDKNEMAPDALREAIAVSLKLLGLPIPPAS